MFLKVTGFENNEPIPEQFAFGTMDEQTRIRLSDNRNPALEWGDIPENAKSLVLICVDPDVPGKPDGVNQEGHIIPADLPRVDFFHWAMVDIAATAGSVAEGECSNGISARGKQQPAGPAGARQGINDYTGWFAGDADMEGQYYGYDGPCPPWNDELLHHYHFVLYATDHKAADVHGAFSGADVMRALDGHVLDEVQVVGTYTLNPNLD